jgi:PAS domain-containing protein
MAIVQGKGRTRVASNDPYGALEGRAERRILHEFGFLAPFYFAVVALAGTVGSLIALSNRLWLLVPIGLALVVFACLRYRRWRIGRLDELAPAELRDRRQFLERAALVLAGVSSTYFVILLAFTTRSEVVAMTGALTLAAVAAAVCFYSRQKLARTILAITLLPPALFVVRSGDDMSLYTAATLIVLGALLALLSRSLAHLMEHYVDAQEADARKAQREAALADQILRLSHRCHFDFGTDGIITSVSAGIATLYNTEASRFTGCSLTALIERDTPVSASGLADIRRAVKAGQAFFDIECLIRMADNSGRCALISGIPIHDDHNQVVAYRAWLNDVTDQRQQSTDMQQTDDRLCDLTALSSECLWEAGEDLVCRVVIGDVRAWPRADRSPMFGAFATPAQPTANHMATEEDLAALKLATEAHGAFTCLRVGTQDDRIVELSGLPQHDAQGTFLGYRGYAKDVTREFEAERALAASTSALARANGRLAADTPESGGAAATIALLEEAMTAIDDGVVVIDAEGQVELINHRGLDLLPPGEWTKGADFLATYSKALTDSISDAEASGEAASGCDLLRKRLQRRRAFEMELPLSTAPACRMRFVPRRGGGFVCQLTSTPAPACDEADLADGDEPVAAAAQTA